MEIQFKINSDDLQEVRKLKKILAILEGDEGDDAGAENGAVLPVLTPPPGTVTELDKITALAKTKTGRPLREAAQHYLAGQKFSLAELGLHLGWNGSKSVSWYAKFSRTCKAWGVRPLQRHKDYPNRYSMTEEVRQAILRAIPATPEEQPAEDPTVTT